MDRNMGWLSKSTGKLPRIFSILTILESSSPFQGWIGLYRGYVSTVVRDLPCALIQFPIWEALKSFFAWRNQCPEERCRFRDAFSSPSPSNLTGFQFALCGFLSGAVAGSVTTPLDVAKTRIMLANVSFTFDFLFTFFVATTALLPK